MSLPALVAEWMLTAHFTYFIKKTTDDAPNPRKGQIGVTVSSNSSRAHVRLSPSPPSPPFAPSPLELELETQLQLEQAFERFCKPEGNVGTSNSHAALD
jgi:hypothetical protein